MGTIRRNVFFLIVFCAGTLFVCAFVVNAMKNGIDVCRKQLNEAQAKIEAMPPLEVEMDCTGKKVMFGDLLVRDVADSAVCFPLGGDEAKEASLYRNEGQNFWWFPSELDGWVYAVKFVSKGRYTTTFRLTSLKIM